MFNEWAPLAGRYENALVAPISRNIKWNCRICISELEEELGVDTGDDDDDINNSLFCLLAAPAAACSSPIFCITLADISEKSGRGAGRIADSDDDDDDDGM